MDGAREKLVSSPIDKRSMTWHSVQTANGGSEGEGNHDQSTL